MNQKLLKLLINLNPNKRQRMLLRNKYFGQEIPQDWPERYRISHNGRHIYTEQDGLDLVYKTLMTDKPCLICRYGSLELDQLDQYVKNKERNISFGNKDYISTNAGFFPATDYYLSRFCYEMSEVSKNIDILALWYFEAEFRMADMFAKNAKLIDGKALYEDNFLSDKPFTRVLKDKKVLVIHPFVETMATQYEKRKVLFKNEDVLPNCDLKFIKAVQSIADSKADLPFKTWFEALDYMKTEIDKVDFDIAIIGCGAYGIFLAEYCKQLGKKAVHMGGATQLLFGIKGKRWDDKSFYNEYWVRPNENEKPKGSEKVEGGCYW